MLLLWLFSCNTQQLNFYSEFSYLCCVCTCFKHFCFSVNDRLKQLWLTYLCYCLFKPSKVIHYYNSTSIYSLTVLKTSKAYLHTCIYTTSNVLFWLENDGKHIKFALCFFFLKSLSQPFVRNVSPIATSHKNSDKTSDPYEEKHWHHWYKCYYNL